MALTVAHAALPFGYEHVDERFRERSQLQLSPELYDRLLKTINSHDPSQVVELYRRNKAVQDTAEGRSSFCVRYLDTEGYVHYLLLVAERLRDAGGKRQGHYGRIVTLLPLAKSFDDFESIPEPWRTGVRDQATGGRPAKEVDETKIVAKARKRSGVTAPRPPKETAPVAEMDQVYPVRLTSLLPMCTRRADTIRSWIRYHFVKGRDYEVCQEREGRCLRLTESAASRVLEQYQVREIVDEIAASDVEWVRAADIGHGSGIPQWKINSWIVDYVPTGCRQKRKSPRGGSWRWYITKPYADRLIAQLTGGVDHGQTEATVATLVDVSEEGTLTVKDTGPTREVLQREVEARAERLRLDPARIAWTRLGRPVELCSVADLEALLSFMDAEYVAREQAAKREREEAEAEAKRRKLAEAKERTEAEMRRRVDAAVAAAVVPLEAQVADLSARIDSLSASLSDLCSTVAADHVAQPEQAVACPQPRRRRWLSRL